jgi:hypothetical protein
MINDPLLNPYIQRLDELPFIIQRHITQLKDSPSISLPNPSTALSAEKLAEAVSISARKLQITGELAGQLQMAVYGLDNSLRSLIENVTEDQGAGVLNTSLPKKSSSKHQYLQRNASSKKDRSGKRLTRSISGRHKSTSGSKRSSKRSQSSSRKKSKRLSSGNKKRIPRQSKSEEEEEAEEPLPRGSLEEEVEMEDQASSASIEEEPEEGVSRRNIEDSDLPEIACLCKKAPYGEMVGCDNPHCPIEWFHLDCVGLERPPTETTWLCPQCYNY